MPAFHVQRSMVINAPVEKVFDTVSDFSRWPIWSPWLRAAKDAKVTVSENTNSVGSSYSWEGEMVGQGEMEHKQLSRPSSLEEELRIIKPWRSVSKVNFEIQPQGDSAKITWHMHGKLPLLMFWMKSMMETFIGMDYERGLLMLKEYIETGEVLSSVDILGVESAGPLDMCGIRESTLKAEMGPAMKKAFDTTMEKMCGHGDNDDADVLSVYHNADLKAGRFDFTSGITVKSATNPPAPLVHCHLPACRALHIQHTGSYENLGNAWSAAHQYARYKKLKRAKMAAFEIYRNDPEQTPRAELVTDIYLPLK